LFAIVSHELRTPLSPVLATADLIEGDAELPEWVREDARMVRRNVELQLRVIEDLLEFNRIEHGKLALRQEPVDLNAVLRDSVRMCEAAAETKGVRLVTDLAPSGGTLSGDCTRLCQLFANLIRNGVKFTPAGGLVTVSSIDTSARTARVQVKDTGVGIPPELLPSVFNAFEQGGDSTTRRYGGLGLGLAIAKGIVEAHAGSIAAHSDGAGQGATFTVELPLRPLAERMLEKQGGERSSSRVLGLV
jgi:signal transduction histidine kinase